MSDVKLGKLAPVVDPRTFRLADLTTAAPAPPREVHQSHREFYWSALGNHTAGDCVPAGAGHMIQAWELETGSSVTSFSDNQIISLYSSLTGYDPTTGANDNGMYLIDMLNYWRMNGILGHKIGAFATVDHKNATQIKQSIYLFGGCYIGLNLPLTSRGQFDTGSVWDVPKGGLGGDGAPGSWGGHCVPILSYDSKRLAVITWGKVQLMTWSFFGTYCDECFAVFSNDMISGGKSPQGFDVPKLQSFLSQL